MNNQIVLKLKKKLEEISIYGNVDVETQRNVIKEELQFYILNFIYHNSDYNKWIMYGGSVLRICHGLDRMSVDLDFEISHPVSDAFLDKLRDDINLHFLDIYSVEDGFLETKITSGRGLKLKFNVGDELEFGHPSKQIHVKIDLNHFVTPKVVTERIPINRDQLSFVIASYNMSSLMASKIAAIFLRGTRGVGKDVYEEKGRDIYDLVWYMGKKIIPDLDYLTAKDVDVKNLRVLFDKLTIQMNKVSNDNLKQDLTPLFIDQTYIKNWLQNWLESYLKLVNDYKINTITTLKSVSVSQDFHTDNFSFIYQYNIEENRLVRVVCNISDYWIDFDDGNLSIEVNPKISEMIDFSSNGVTTTPASREKLNQYATLFYQKIEGYFKKTNNVMLGNTITTKVIRMTADNLNQKEQIVLNKSALLSCELDDLFK
jgi:hypothetical protein